jgi:hypothetical protein
VRLVVGAVEVDTVPAGGEQEVGSDTALALALGELLRVELVVHAGRASVTAEVGAGVAAVAVLALHVGVDCASGGVTDEHAETL